MKSRQIYFLILLFTLSACKTAIDRKNGCAIELTKMNVLYVGVDNPAEIIVQGANSADIEVYIDNGKVEKSNGFYNLRPEKTGEATITILANGQIVSQKQYIVKEGFKWAYALVGDSVTITIRWDDNRRKYLSKKQILESNEFVGVCLNSDYQLNHVVVGFTIVVKVEEDLYSATAESSLITEAQKDLIRKSTGDRIWIEEIKMSTNNGEIKNTGDITIYIVK